MRRRSHLGGGLVVGLAFALLLANSDTALASGTTRWVNDNDPNGGLYVPPGTSCNNPGYYGIQKAVNVSSSGDRINVCSGEYIEEVTIPYGKNNLLLRSVSFWAAVIKAPAVMLGPTKSIVRVNGARGVTILAFTITGPGGSPCDSLRYGVRVDDGGSAAILGNHITRIHDNPFSGCQTPVEIQNGVAIQVGRRSEGTTGSARILGNVIDTYQKNGPTVDNTGSHAEIAHNRILGIGPTALIAQNGIQASRGATAVIRHNFVSRNIFSPGVRASTGILLSQPGQVSTDHNTVSSNDVGVEMSDPAAGSKTALNRVRASTIDGIRLFPATSNRVEYNKADQNNGPGIGVYDSQSNTLLANYVDRNSDGGILLETSSNNDVTGNGVTNNGTSDGVDTTDGIRLGFFSTGNTVRNNRLKHNKTHDCHDDNPLGNSWFNNNPLGNSWVNNDSQTSQPRGLCPSHDDGPDDSYATSSAYGWDPNFSWYLEFPDAVEYDWTGAYATIDTDTLLQLLPQIRLGTTRAAIVSPVE